MHIDENLIRIGMTTNPEKFERYFALVVETKKEGERIKVSEERLAKLRKETVECGNELKTRRKVEADLLSQAAQELVDIFQGVENIDKGNKDGLPK